MNIFNSLGSNYTFLSALGLFCAWGGSGKRQQLIDALEKRYDGKAILTYKGREALQSALEAVGERCGVAITGFTCVAVCEAIEKSGCTARYLDIEDTSLNFSAETLRAALDKHSSIKVAIVQNTLGFPCDIRAIAQLCAERGVVLIEDLAHSVGSRYVSGEAAGKMGDFTMLSFSQDKVIDAISGGALIIRNPAYVPRLAQPTAQVGVARQMKNRLYLLITVLIRLTYPLGIGARIQTMLRSYYARAYTTTKSATKGSVHDLPNALCARILREFENLESDSAHRREIADIYARNIDPRLLRAKESAEIAHSTCLRFPIMVDDRESLVAYCLARGLDIHDTWYDAPVAPKKILAQTSYAGECPVAEKTAAHIANLPTHRQVTVANAHAIAQLVNEWHYRAV
jgi:dTDP-4-amino-4,6-dideoxygalactose transaminase